MKPSLIEEIFTYSFLTKIFNKLLYDDDKINIIKIIKICNLELYDYHFCNQKDKEKEHFNNFTNIVVVDNFELPRLTKKLTLGFSNGIVTIPNSVIHLTFIETFYKPVKIIIPDSVRKITLGSFFKADFKDFVTNFVKKIVINSPFTDPAFLTNLQITDLSLGDMFTEYAFDNLPNSIVTLKLGRKFANKQYVVCFHTVIVSRFPQNLKYLYCSQKFVELNKNLLNDNINVIILG